MRATGVGSMPGGAVGEEADNARLFAEATRIVLGELDLPHLPELPGRGAVASMTGRACGLITELGFDLQPAGWRLTDATGLDQRRAGSLLAQDLDELERQAQGLTGVLKVQVAGPWTLAATVERPRGDRVLSDVGARREIAEALALAVADHLSDVRGRLPGAEVLLQLDEPALPAVLAGKVPTASGFGRHRTVRPPEASLLLETVIGAVDADVVVHCCAPDVPIELLVGAGAAGVSVDIGALAASSYDGLAGVVERGEWALLGAVPSVEPAAPITDRVTTGRVGRLLDMLGLAPTDRMVVTPACGLAGASASWARTALSLARAAARSLDQAQMPE